MLQCRCCRRQYYAANKNSSIFQLVVNVIARRSCKCGAVSRLNRVLLLFFCHCLPLLNGCSFRKFDTYRFYSETDNSHIINGDIVATANHFRFNDFYMLQQTTAFELIQLRSLQSIINTITRACAVGFFSFNRFSIVFG